jgi:hypothetical protein
MSDQPTAISGQQEMGNGVLVESWRLGGGRNSRI